MIVAHYLGMEFQILSKFHGDEACLIRLPSAAAGVEFVDPLSMKLPMVSSRLDSWSDFRRLPNE
jgi:hypothetical protein